MALKSNNMVNLRSEWTTQSHRWGGGGGGREVLPIKDYAGGSAPRGIPFSA